MKKYKRVYKHKRVRRAIGNSRMLRVSVFRSNQHIYAQLIDDKQGRTLAYASDMGMAGPKVERAAKVGEALSKAAIEAKASEVVFDRGGFRYHGRVAALAEGLRKGGLKF